MGAGRAWGSVEVGRSSAAFDGFSNGLSIIVALDLGPCYWLLPRIRLQLSYLSRILSFPSFPSSVRPRYRTLIISGLLSLALVSARIISASRCYLIANSSYIFCYTVYFLIRFSIKVV